MISKIPMKRIVLLAAVMLFLVGCGKTIHPVQMVVHSEPQGGYVLYKAPQTYGQWVYLGSTPVKTVQMIDEETMTENSKFKLRILRNGFHEQVKEWDGERFLETFEDQGKIFWTPHLVRSKM